MEGKIKKIIRMATYVSLLSAIGATSLFIAKSNADNKTTHETLKSFVMPEPASADVPGGGGQGDDCGGDSGGDCAA